MNVSELCVPPTEANGTSNKQTDSYPTPDAITLDNDTNNKTSNNDNNIFTLPPLSQQHTTQQRLPSLANLSPVYDAIEEQTVRSSPDVQPVGIKELIDKCTTLCHDLARYKTWRKGSEKDHETIFDFVTHTAHEILDSLVAMQQQQEAVVSNEAEYEMIRKARNWKENRKPKYRRRSKRSTVGQQCHSCLTSETPEWRRGPDGARTLCNACGLHYSKLLRKESITVASYNFLTNGVSDGTRKTSIQESSSSIPPPSTCTPSPSITPAKRRIVYEHQYQSPNKSQHYDQQQSINKSQHYNQQRSPSKSQNYNQQQSHPGQHQQQHQQYHHIPD
ncbi:uncharacterized protein BX664DRAFT_327225 [Halteromyces radiatus]|uniref:uncharacterized protein n=1 Tax=Halteromyces radiatus TaxID=101107 RepID=UPI00221F12DA|nr:uncharacterized protein BX664DRAFT_327225 [Halteromyces radiatus]KAI8097772.1 hypothetical protein BX664DRAFT_327225 [Halteromyces radiatus]